jgi:hypothetical protein
MISMKYDFEWSKLLMGNGNETDFFFHKSVQQGVSPVSCSGIEERVTVPRMLLLGLNS